MTWCFRRNELSSEFYHWTLCLMARNRGRQKCICICMYFILSGCHTDRTVRHTLQNSSWIVIAPPGISIAGGMAVNPPITLCTHWSTMCWCFISKRFGVVNCNLFKYSIFMMMEDHIVNKCWLQKLESHSEGSQLLYITKICISFRQAAHNLKRPCWAYHTGLSSCTKTTKHYW